MTINIFRARVRHLDESYPPISARLSLGVGVNFGL